jgi:D-inositol-3-phosphate glycosyltransferase
MRIAMVSEHASPLAVLDGVGAGGSHQHVAELSATLREMGHDVRVFSRRTGSDQPDRVTMPSGVVVEHLTAGPVDVLEPAAAAEFAGDLGGRLAEAWRNWRPEVAHAHGWVSGLAALAARASVPMPLVATYHDLRRGADARRIEDELRLGRLAERVVAQHSAELREMVDRGIPRASITLVPGAVDTDHFSPDGPAAPRDGHRARILAVGRLVEHEGYPALIRALRLLPGAELVIVGGRQPDAVAHDPAARRLTDLARGYDLLDRVHLTGAIPRAELPRWYRSADVVACTPSHTSFGVTSLEAMSCGAPVVAYASGGLADTVVDGVTGTLVPPKDERSLARALRRLLKDPLRRMAYATAAIDRARACYSWRRAAEQLQRLYDDVTAGYVQPLGGPATGAVTG